MNESEKPPAAEPLRSVHTTTFPELLDHLGASLLVTTYQAGKLVVLRNGPSPESQRANSGVLNTHFRNFNKPMGLAVAPGKFAIGCHVDIWEFHNVTAVCPKLDQRADEDTTDGDKTPDAQRHIQEGQAESHAADPAKASPFPSGQMVRHDGCFLPRRSHTTGDVQIHEMAWVGDDLVFVNTAFSCLATRSDQNSFEPIWRPPFVTALAPYDSCHLNGLALRNGKVRYVTALGATDTAGGWRENKRDGGVLIDVEANEIISRGLSMPHSPRWHADRLWLLESGRGTFGWVDPASGRYEPIVELPGFTRGLALYGPWAFIGLSQVRESAVFSGIPLVERLNERTCGVWVVNTDTGRVVAFCRFEEAVQEVFAVELLPGMRYPDVVNHDAELIASSYVLSQSALKEVPENLRASGS